MDIEYFKIAHFIKAEENDPRVEVADLSSYSISVGDFYMLVRARVDHHVPRVTVQPISPVIIAL